MDYTTPVILGLHPWLRYSAEAMFDIDDLCPDARVLDAIGAPGRDGFVLCCAALELLSIHGRMEAARRHIDPLPPQLSASALRASALPGDVAELKRAALAAILAGLKRDVPDSGARELPDEDAPANP